MCREESISLREEVKPKLDLLGINIVMVVKETVGINKFVERYWKTWDDVYIDLDKKVFPIVNGSSMSITYGVFNYYLGGQVAKNLARVDAKGIKGNLEGEGKKLGGLGVFAPDGTLVYLFQEKHGGTTHSQRIFKAVATFAPDASNDETSSL